VDVNGEKAGEERKLFFELDTDAAIPY